MDVMALATNAMQLDTAKLQGIAHNLGNALTSGYRKQVVIPGVFAAQFTSVNRPDEASMPSLNLVRYLDATAGTLRNTGLATDLAIEGDGMFELEGPSGRVYTRRGEFHVDTAGRLLSAQDFAVMGDGGEIALSGEPFQIAANGEISQAGSVVARLKVMRFSSTEMLEPLGGANYAQGRAVAVDTAAVVRLRVGYLENSNVDSAREMVDLTETVRHYEAMQKIVQGYDELLEKSIRKLGDF